ncbi:MAG: FkbM family methyltransferase, partial [Armatimonadota bacterium]|nr:FkbM family methyltransferase [Armatimonadota bacterium]
MARLLVWSGLCRFWYIPRDGYRLRFYPSSVSMALWEYPEGWRQDSKVLRQLLRPGDVYIDVGANIGHLALEAAQCVGEAGQVYAFEAHPTIAQYLRENVQLNRFSNVR